MVRNIHFVGEICFAPTIPTITTIHKFVQCNVHDWALLRIRVKQHLDNGAESPFCGRNMFRPYNPNHHNHPQFVQCNVHDWA